MSPHEEGFKLLTRADFDSFEAQQTTWEATSEGIRCRGRPKGYLFSKQSFRNFELRLQLRYLEPEEARSLERNSTKPPGQSITQTAHQPKQQPFHGNTGILVFIVGEHKIWPVCLEVQGKYSELGTIKANGGAEQPQVEDHPDVRERVRRNPYDWQELSILALDGALTVKLNGEIVARSQPAFLSEGQIGFQAEGFPYEVQRIRIRELP